MLHATKTLKQTGKSFGNGFQALINVPTDARRTQHGIIFPLYSQLPDTLSRALESIKAEKLINPWRTPCPLSNCQQNKFDKN